MSKKKILIFISHYLPGYKMGGPLNSILNIVKNLSKYFDFYIITSDRDFGEKKQYENIQVNKWLNIGEAKVLYIRNGFKGYKDILTSIKETNFDVIYLNSFFEFKFSIYVALLRYFNFIKIKKLILAVRGEFYEEALAFKKQKKNIYLRLIKFIKIYKNICWHSTDISESNEIIKIFSAKANIQKASVLSDTTNYLKEIKEPVFKFNDDVLKVVFLSRISKDKNLMFTYNVLKKIKRNLEFHIYGPIEDHDIWDDYEKKIKSLPNNIFISYKGSVKKENVKAIISKYDIFFLPTHRENFGHVISESLSVGTPVLISNNTPWLNLEKARLGWDIDLTNIGDFVNVLETYNLSEEFNKYKRKKVIENFNTSINFSSIIKENIDLFN
jgi:glycosyltransferase involved in cell wall biosynthesis